MESVFGFVFYLLVILFSVVIHEVSHGATAQKLGDDTASKMGRLTLNPLSHIDPFGSIILPLILYFSGLGALAWARPVPYNPYNFRGNYRSGAFKVAIAGPLSNILLMLIFALLGRAFFSILSPLIIGLFGFIAFINAFLAFFNLVPIPPLDGSKLLPLILPASWAARIERIGLEGIILVFIFVYIFSGIIHSVSFFAFRAAAGNNVVLATQAVSLRILRINLF